MYTVCGSDDIRIVVQEEDIDLINMEEERDYKNILVNKYQTEITEE